jgi:hypothetical protein
MKVALATVSLAFLLLAACGDDGEGSSNAGDEALFSVEDADDLAHAAMVEPEDLPGDDWEVVARDAFDDDDDGGAAFLELAQDEAACQQISDLATLGDIMGSEEDGDEADFAGRAKIELERAVGADTVPSSVEVEVEILESVGDAQDGWGVARSILQSDDTADCIVSLMGAMMAEEVEGVEVTLETIEPLADPPDNGAALAFAMNLAVADILSIDAVMGLYMWPYSNATIQVVVLGDKEDMTGDVVAEIIEAVDAKVRAAAD